MTENADTSMSNTNDATAATTTTTTTTVTTATTTKVKKSHELVTATIKSPRYSYAHLELFSDTANPGDLDALQVRSYCTSALKQFLGTTGVGIPIDILKVEGKCCWLRLPRDDLPAFSAAITAWQGSFQDRIHSSLRIKGCSDWLGSLVGRDSEDKLWSA
ncbi:uncharacterized protein GGS25DRAFT_292949 [Hypoxylon fragiforme]|uniref:uncharacterized protein n=1 Tax=Hypoxylon fragiforme TaxID=63214 RepID=UPI0020C68F72|nr:uncharacterized protein GGS25DRAFT_292949 [Hypoxylon fragiforme]KAI2608828.1 hypothetical protein GGS25DRAFT_292949 [Hypoxylon fragiforme]